MLTTHRAGDVPRDVTHIARLEAGRIVAAGPVGVEGRAKRPRLRVNERRGSQPNLESTRAALEPTDLVRLRNATVYRDGRAVFSRLDWTLKRGEHWCVTGPNGAGKSTFLTLLHGDLWPAVGGRIERSTLPAGAPIEDWKRLVGLVSPELQATYAATDCTVEEIVASGLHSSIGLDAPPTRAESAAVRRALTRVGLLELRRRRARELSYGQLRLVLFARATVAPRRLLLLDELFDGLDERTRARLMQMLDRAVRDGTQLVLATHHRDDVPRYVRRTLEFRLRRAPLVTS
ncbi:MAG: ATP-binding cassette domain-containing protein [Gammaproteobacteria bacterium]|nr:ATP-binding cassette domain-containing protein [Gammaproteobacteria bacterium]